MATFGEALDAMRNDYTVQLPDGSSYCLCSNEELLTDIVSPEIANMIASLSGVLRPLFFKSDPAHKVAQFGWLPTMDDLLRDDWIIPGK
jgi:hypothetical protein